MNRLIFISPRALKAALILAPMVLYGLYLAFVASDRYVSESVIAVRQASGSDAVSAIPGAALLLAGLNSPAHEDTMHLRTFVQSQTLAEELEAKLKLKAHFGAIKLDLPFRLPSDASLEDFLRYYRDRVDVSYDERAALLKIRTQGLDPAYAQTLNRTIVEACERFVNETSHRMAREQLKFAEGEMELANRRVQQAARDVLEYQNAHKMLDPTIQAQATGALTVELQAVRSRLEAELRGTRGFLNEDSFQVAALKARIAALDHQIDEEKARATANDPKEPGLSKLAIEFQGLQMKAEFARDAYKLAVASVENSRIETSRKIKSLVIVEPPTRPETAEYPQVGYNLATLFVVCMLLYTVVRLVLATIREHQD